MTSSAPVGVTSSLWTPDEYTGAPASSFTVAGAGTGKVPVRGMHHPAADVQRRADDAIGLEPFDREHRADDVDDRVEGAHFVQMNLLDRNLVDRGFGLAKTMEERFGPRLRVRRQRRPLDQLVDFRKAAMRMLMRDGRGRVCMRVLWRVRVSVIVCIVACS